MLRSLHIVNYAIIQNVQLSFDHGLNIITGETGAGKSIILGAINLIRGQRADTKVLYNKEEKCIVEAVYEDYPKSIDTLLTDAQYDVEEELIIRREISKSGKSRAFINDSPAKLDLLQNIAAQLLDLNAQYDISEIQDANYQLQMIDAFAGTKSLVDNYQDLFNTYQKYLKERDLLIKKEAEQRKATDFIQFQIAEFDALDLQPNELNTLEEEKEILDRSGDISDLKNEMVYRLFEDESNLIDILRNYQYRWEQLNLQNEVAKNLVKTLYQIEDSYVAVKDFLDDLDAHVMDDPKRKQEIEERLDAIYKLQNKHQVDTLEGLLTIYEDLKGQVGQFEADGARRDFLNKEIENLENTLLGRANKISSKREKSFKSFEKSINGLLDTMAMGSADIKVQNRKLDKLNAQGIDDVQLLFKSNKGAAYNKIKGVASGGERSRLMLALKSTIAHKMSLPTMIYDEIDTGISGDIAGKMGDILKEMSTQHQLICITHSPQVAARATTHFNVYKTEEKDTTVTHVSVLDTEARINELAKMLSGDPPSNYAMKNAKELIGVNN